MDGFIQLFSEYDVPAAFLVNIELTLWSALFSLILGVVLVMMRISPISLSPSIWSMFSGRRTSSHPSSTRFWR